MVFAALPERIWQTGLSLKHLEYFPRTGIHRETPVVELRERVAQQDAAVAGPALLGLIHRRSDISDLDISHLDGFLADQHTTDPVDDLYFSRVGLSADQMTMLHKMGFSLAGSYAVAPYFVECHLKFMDLSGKCFDGMDLRYAGLGKSRLVGTSFVGANLAWANFRFSNLSDADLTRADLRGADLTGDTTWLTRLGGANLTGAVFDATTEMPDHFQLRMALLAGVDLRFLSGKEPWKDAPGWREQLAQKGAIV